jgi:ribosomal protein S18 acetylase RimI-like enzyme
MKDASIRQARVPDLSAVTAIATAAFALYVPRMDREPAPMLADYTALIHAHAVWVAEQGDQIVGFLVAMTKGADVFVATVALEPSWQGAGIGRGIMRFAEERAADQGCARVALYTNAVMHENIAFYQRLGCTITDRRMEDGYQRIYFAKGF